VIHTYRKVEYISPSRELKATKRFYKNVWSKDKEWITMVTEEVAERCGEFPNDFKIYPVEEQARNSEYERLLERIVALETEFKARKGGRPRRESEPEE
jgi:hypothetical protein